MDIHSTAIVEEGAILEEGVKIGAYSIIGNKVRLGKGTEVDSHCRIIGKVKIGNNCRIYSGCIIGEAAQVKAADPQGDEESGVNIGDNNVFREYVTVHRSMYPYNYTSLGNNNYIMSGVHIAHDCKIGNNVVITNYTGLTGHVEIEDNVVISGLVAIHQFVRIGTLAMIGGNSKVTQDVIPYMLADGHPAKIRSINTVGLKRFSWDEESRNILKQIIRILYFSNSSLKEALAEIEERWGNLDFIQHLINFIRNSKRGICGPMRRK